MNKRIQLANIKSSNFVANEAFKKIFPTLARLLAESHVIEFTIENNQRFRQYIWLNDDKISSGWLCRLEHCVPQGRNIIDEQILLAKTMGGIVDYWTATRSSIDHLLRGQDHLFSLTDTYQGIGDWDDIYLSECEGSKCQPLDLEKFVTFALETNGNAIFYNYESKEVFTYLHDGYSPFEVKTLQGQPEYTIHKFEDVDTFVDFVELLANQWKRILKQ